MAKPKKEKKLARKERQEQLRSAAEHVKERLLADTLEPTEEVQYVLDEEADGLQSNQSHGAQSQHAGAHAGAHAGGEHDDYKGSGSDDEDEEEQRVKLPAAPGASSATAQKKAKKSTGAGRKHHRMSWQALKLAVTDRYGAEAAELVSEHDGNAQDPFFTVLLKMQPHTVPVPRHWSRLRSFLSLQSDREEAVGIIPAEIQALGVDKLRASKDKRAGPDQIAFMTCFMTGTPLQRKTFGVELSKFGDTFSEGKWLPKAHFEPGVLSQRLRQALGMAGNAPPPWLHSMQTMRRLPPAFPGLRVPGLNAPIPAGAQWGRGQGQWGDPPRGESNNFLFPGVMDETAASAANAVRLWGVVPPLATDEGTATAGAGGGGGAGVSPPPAPAPASPPPPAAAKATITPTPFRPQAYQPQVPATARYVSTTPQEYVRVQDSGRGATVAVGHKMVLKGNAGPAAATAPRGNAPNARYPQQQQQHGAKNPPPRPAAKQPQQPPPPANNNRGTKF